MADFSAASTNVQQIETATSQKAGVSKGPNIFDLGSNLLGGVRSTLEGVRQRQQETAISDFSRQQLLVAEGLAQGRIKSSAHAQTMLRVNLLNAVESNPQLAKDFISIQSTLTGLTGGAKVIADGTQEEQQMRKRRDDLVSSGELSYNATDSEFMAADKANRLAVTAQKRFDEEMDAILLQKSRLDLTSAQKSEIQQREKEAANSLIKDTSASAMAVMKNNFEQILSSNASESEKVAAIEDYFSEFQTQTASTFANIDASARDVYEPIFSNLRDVYLSRARGESTDAEAKREIDRNLRVAELAATSDPDIARLVIAQKYIGADGFAQILLKNPNAPVQKKAMEFILGAAGGGDLPSVLTDDKSSAEGQRAALDLILQGVLDNDTESNEQASTALQNALNDIEDSQGKIVRDPKKAIAIVDWIGSPDFLKAIRRNPEAFGNIDGVNSVLQQHFFDEVLGLIESEFTNNSVSVGEGGSRRTGRKSQFAPTGSVVEAIPTESGINFQAIDPDNARARKEAARLNQELKPIINNFVRAQSHLFGHSDYKGVVESTMQDLFGEAGEDRVAGGDEGDDLTMDDFVFPSVSGENLPAEVQEDEPFLSAVEELSAKLEIDPAVMLAVMDFETGGSFNPAQKNAAGSSATGLIQFMAATAKGLGTSTKELASMNRLEQMKYVEKYFDQHADKIRGGDAADVYMAVLFPKAANKPDDYVLFREGTLAYKQNRGLDKSGDGTITKKEAAAKVVSLVGKYKDS